MLKKGNKDAACWSRFMSTAAELDFAVKKYLHII
jgi:hypothetical protein